MERNEVRRRNRRKLKAIIVREQNRTERHRTERHRTERHRTERHRTGQYMLTWIEEIKREKRSVTILIFGLQAGRQTVRVSVSQSK